MTSELFGNTPTGVPIFWNSDKPPPEGTRPMKLQTPNQIRAEHGLPPARPDWLRYFLDIAKTVATRADCTRRQVGAVIVDEHNRIAGTGYNGGPAGGASCLAGECPRGLLSTDQVAPGSSYDTGAGSCIALHAEQNAIMYSDVDRRRGGTIYITCEPCEGCMRMMKGSGLRHVVWSTEDGGHRSVPLY